MSVRQQPEINFITFWRYLDIYFKINLNFQTQALLTHMQRGGRSQGMRGDRVETVCSPESEYSCSVAEK